MRFGRNRRYDSYEREEERMRRFIKGGKLYRTISTIAIIGVFLAIAVLVFGLSYLGISPAVFGFALSIGIICLSLITTLPWIKRIEEKQSKKLSIVFLSLIGVCALLWIIAIWLVVALVYSGSNSSDTQVATLLLIVKIAIILSTQLLVSSFIGNMILRYGKELIPFQIITSISYLFIDFYVTYLFACISIKPGASSWINVSEALTLLGTRLMITLLVLSIAFAVASATVIKSVETRRMRRSMDAMADSGIVLDDDHVPVREERQSTTPTEAKATPEQRLEKLKSMYEQNLITEEEYNQKRSDILKEM